MDGAGRKLPRCLLGQRDGEDFVVDDNNCCSVDNIMMVFSMNSGIYCRKKIRGYCRRVFDRYGAEDNNLES